MRRRLARRDAARAGPHAREERDPRGADALPQGAAAGVGPVRRQGPALARRSRSCPIAERETVDAAMRQVEFLDAEIAAVERLIAAEALSWPEVKRLMTVPGVNVIVAATFMAAVGDIAPLPRPAQADRLPRPRSARPSVGCRARESRPHLEAGLGVRSPRARRGELVDRPPAGPDRRLLRPDQGAPRPLDRDRRVGAQARLPVLVPADRGEDYAFAQPSLTKKKLRRLELQAGAPRFQGGRGVWSTNDGDAQGRARARATGPARLRTHRQGLAGRRRGAGATAGRASSGSSKDQVARQTTSP